MPCHWLYLVSEEEIYNLREQGLSYNEIVQRFKDKGIEVSWPTISDRCKKIYEEKGKEEGQISEKVQINHLSGEADSCTFAANNQYLSR